MRVERNVENLVSRPRWLADFVTPQTRGLAHFPARLEASQFTDADALTVKLTANANSGSTSLTITALALPWGIKKIPSGTVLYFGGAKVAQLDQDYTGGTSMHVLSTPTNMVIGDSATYLPYGIRKKVLEGTPVGRTYTERDNGTGFGPADVNDDEIYLTWRDVLDANTQPDIELVNHFLAIKQNYLPTWTALSTATVVAAVNEVQRVRMSGTLSGGQFKVAGIRASDGSFYYSDDIAYNANTAAIQTGYDTVFGAGLVVIGGTGTVADHTATYSGVGYAGIDQPRIIVDSNEITGITHVQIDEVTKGVPASSSYPMLAKLRTLYTFITGAN